MAISQDFPRDDPNTRVWLITGTSSGMGRALVKSVLDRNDKVIATARVLEQIQDLRSLADPSRLHLMQLDITDSQDVISSKVNEAIDVWGRIDVLVNNAGTGVKMILEEGGVEGIIHASRERLSSLEADPHLRTNSQALAHMLRRRLPFTPLERASQPNFAHFPFES